MFKGYIYSIPKSGTYLFAKFLSSIGYEDTGWHISLNEYLDTKNFDVITNKEHPSATEKKQLYLKSFRQIKPGAFAFGHFNPMYIPPQMLRQFRIIVTRRHPREVLVSEFIDFRHRRKDTVFSNLETFPAPEEAFFHYMNHHAPIIRNVCRNHIILSEIWALDDYRELIAGGDMMFVDFRSFLDREKGSAIARHIAKFMGNGADEGVIDEKYLAALEADNKTKSSDIDVPYSRNWLWSERNMAIYSALGFPEIEAKLGYSSNA